MGNKRKHSDCAEHITKSVSRAVSRAPLSRLVKAGSPEQYKSTCKEDDAIIIARPPPLKKARVTKPGDDIDIVQPAERSMLTKSQGRQKLISAYLMKEKEVESEEKKKTAKMAAYFSFLHKVEKIVKKKDKTVKKKEEEPEEEKKIVTNTEEQGEKEKNIVLEKLCPLHPACPLCLVCWKESPLLTPVILYQGWKQRKGRKVETCL